MALHDQAEGARAPISGVSRGELIALSRVESDDLTLVAGLIDRQPAAVAELFDRYATLVRGILIRTLGSAEDADDLVQDTMLVVVRRVGTLQKPEALRSFIVSVTLRTAKNELRKRALRRWIGLDDAPEYPITPAHDPVAVDRVRRVYQALERLDAASRVLFVLRHIEQLELTELAEANGCSLATIKRRLLRAEKRFEAIVRNDPELCDFLERAD
jgi:RNA polymerase sigma-70 factor (ECF subfamily)